MARMHPRSLLEEELKSQAEGRVFEALRDGLPDEWEVFHSVGWVERDRDAGAVDGEIDFVLCHPDRGILCLEVKGGGLECRHGEFLRLDRDGRAERMRDPFAQALDHRYALQRRLARNGLRDVLVGHAVAFPDISVHSLALAPDAPGQIVIDRRALEDVGAAVERVLAYHRGARDGRRPPGRRGADRLRDLLAPRISIRVPMAAEFLGEDEHIVRLTHQQSALLGRFARDRRMVVTGCAGSGKTMLAVEHAKRLARKGLRVAYVCFNRALRDHLREREASSGVLFHTFHGLCVQLAGEAGIDLPTHPPDQAPPEFFRETLPDALADAATALGGRFDALMVDEAQDLETHWLTALTMTLRDERRGTLWLFMDDNQRVYHVRLDVPPEFRPFDLTVNCRNTQAIHAEIIKLYDGEVEPEVLGPPGREVELHRTDDQPRTVAGVLQRLCGEEEVPPQDVVILSAHAFARSKVAQSLPGRYRPTTEAGRLGRWVHFSSIRAFKGLEARVVILCELEDLDPRTRDQQLYVGLSRARNHCVVVVPRPR